ncbi:MAG: hypothetical protein MUD16_09685 [Desulfobacterales bacterium]|jgi:hypothetical protein|nr:hypothetical protein [Desulfobacterales bacterium]
MDLAYPAVKLFKNDPRIYAYADARSFHLASTDLIGLYAGARFIDAAGTEVRVREAYRTGWGTRLWGYHPLIKGRTATIDFAVEGTRAIGLPEFKRLVLERLSPATARPGWYPAAAERIRPRVEQAESFGEIMALFLYDIESQG